MKQVKDKKKHKAVIKEKRAKGLIPEKEEPVEEDDEDDEDDEDYESDDAAEALLDMEADETDDDEDDSDDDEEETGAMNTAAMMNESDTDSESEVDMEEKIVRPKNPRSILKKGETEPKKAAEQKKKNKKTADDEDQQDDDEESDIALSDLEDMPEEDREDLYVQTRLTINNQPALLAALKRISIPKGAGVPFLSHQTVASSEPTEPKIEDISDDLNRELQLYAQSLEGAKRARALLRAEGAPFSRPKDYFAEMVKDDGHMQKVKEKLVEDATAKKASAEARKLRDLKKFGKQVQVAKLQERQKEKKDTLEKIKALKKSMLSLPLLAGLAYPPSQADLTRYTAPPPPLILCPPPHLNIHAQLKKKNTDKTFFPTNRALRERRRDRHHRGGPLRRRGRQRAQQAGQAGPGRRAGRPVRAQQQAGQEGRQVRLRRQEEVRQVRGRGELGRPVRLQCQEDEGPGRPRRRGQAQVVQDGAAGQGQEEGRGREAVICLSGLELRLSWVLGGGGFVEMICVTWGIWNWGVCMCGGV